LGEEELMDTQDFGFLSEGAAEPRPDLGAAPTAPTEAPLTDRETVGFYRAMQEEREKRQVLERQLAEIKAAGEPPPSPAVERDLGVTIYANNLRVSRRFAEREYGREVVSAIHDWAAAKCDADPAFNKRMRASDDPYEAAKQIYDDEHALRNTQKSQSATPPPRSLADAPGNGAVGKPHVPVGDGNAYESLFN
jgi:hypothetical protein